MQQLQQKLVSPRVLPIVASAVVVLAAAVSWFFVVSPQRSHAATLDAKIVDKQLELTSAKLVARRTDQKADLKKLRLVSVAMPDNVEMTSLLLELIRAADAGTVRLDGITAQALAPLQGYSAVPLDVKVTGKYLGIKLFLHRLEAQADAAGDRLHASGRLFAIDSVDFEPSQDELPILTATVHLNAFVFVPAVPKPAAPVPAPTPTASATGRTS
jgi:hypothetical protein